MAGVSLITISLFVNVLAICKSVIGSYPYLAPNHGSVVYVPVCSPECLKHTQSCDLQNLAQNNFYSSSGVQGQHSPLHGRTDYQHTIHHHGSGVSHHIRKQEHLLDGSNGEYDNHHHDHNKKNHNVHYQFEYAVHDHKTGDVKHHKEERKGDDVTGEYSLLEEDGNVRTVKYYADWKTGFHAQVHNSKPKPT